ncbi:glycosyltransferase family 9 protein [Paraburkholderia youngii]|uniref:glycosyltransferase family 9 protein n=1 Tax=Paraburkholderia youngii TaxID=2782701 RepID=UPI00281653FB|nr:glycosyltransferase family 9 protein [Paraburkholderia youngii]
MAEAGWFIGNDSGLGHLASAIGVPTLSLFMRSGLARTCRPGWSPGAIVLPLNVVPTGRLRERCWKRLMSVRRVLRGFETLRDAARKDERSVGKVEQPLEGPRTYANECRQVAERRRTT